MLVVLFLLLTYFPIDEDLPFTQKDIKIYLQLMIEYRVHFYAATVYFAYYAVLFYIQNHGLLGAKQFVKPKYVLKLLFSALLFFALFSNSMHPFRTGLSIQAKENSYILSDKTLLAMYQKSYPFHLSNSYGLFRRMTGVGGRPELIFQGSNDGKTWLDYEFHYKPGNTSSIPGFIMPHQPRLDWQLWFAALTDKPNEEWLVRPHSPYSPRCTSSTRY